MEKSRLIMGKLNLCRWTLVLKVLAFYLFCLTISSCLSASLVGWEPTTKNLNENYIAFFEKEDLPQEIQNKLPDNPKIYFPGKSDTSFYGDIDDIVYQKASSEFYRIMGYGEFITDKQVWLNDGWELASTAGKDIIKRLINFCVEKSGYELYCCRVSANEISSSHNPIITRGIGNNMYVSSEWTTNWHRFKYYVITPFSEEEVSLWKLGIDVRDIKKDERKNVKRNTGALITMVYENYPGFNANLNTGDIITKINDIDIFDSQDFIKCESILKNGDLLQIEYVRDGINQTTKTKIK